MDERSANICPLPRKLKLDLPSVIKQQKQPVGGTLFAVHAVFSWLRASLCICMRGYVGGRKRDANKRSDSKRSGRRLKKKRWHFEWTSKAQAVSHLHLTVAFSTSQHRPVSLSHMCAKSNGETLLNHFERSHVRSGSPYCSFKSSSKLARNHYTPLTPFLGPSFPGLMPGHVYTWL